MATFCSSPPLSSYMFLARSFSILSGTARFAWRFGSSNPLPTFSGKNSCTVPEKSDFRYWGL